MKIQFAFRESTFEADLSSPVDISIPITAGLGAVNCFWAPPVAFDPVIDGDFKGSTALGGPVNFFNIKLNPHGNGTHTECVGHIAKEPYVLKDCFKRSHFFAKLLTVFPEKAENGDRILYKRHLESFLSPGETTALIVRTEPNSRDKLTRQYSGTNPPYFHFEALAYLADCGVEHLLTDLPSVDRESDGGQLLGHKAFWRYPAETRQFCTITELIYVPTDIPDGDFLLDIQTLAIDLDASPSRPVLFYIKKL